MTYFRDIQLLISSMVILLFCLTPVFLFRKSVKETFLVGFSIILFLFFYKDFFFGIKSTYHDTFWGLQPYFLIMRQWLNGAFYPGWNPYMNGGEPIYLFSNFYLHAPFVFFCILGKFIKISTDILFNHCFIFMFLNFCIGSFLLFCELFENFKVAFFCFAALLLSSCFDINLGQPIGLIVLYLFPYIIFGLLNSFKNRTPYGIVFAIIYMGLSLNHYNPLYIYSIVFFYIVMLFLFKPLYVKTIYLIVKKYNKWIFLAVFLAILAAGPAIYFNYEIKDFVSPSRGSLGTGAVLTLEQTGTQPRVIAYLSGYKILLERVLIDKYGGIHHAFYFAIIPLFFIAIALFVSKNRFSWIFFITAIFAVLVGTGGHFIMALLYKYVPIFSMLRHPCWFAPFVSFLLICTSGFGLKVILYDGTKNRFRIILISIIVSLGLLLATKDSIGIVLIMESFFVILASIFSVSIIKNKTKSSKLTFLWIFIILMADLYFLNTRFLTYIYSDPYNIQYYHFVCYPPEDIGDPYPIKYPHERTFYGSRSSPISLNLFPVFLKEANINSPREDLVLFRNSRLHDMLGRFIPSAGYEPAFGVGVPLIYFTNNVQVFPSDLQKEAMIDEIYEDASRQESLKYPKVYFQNEDIDFDIPNIGDGDFVYLPIKKLEEADNPNRIRLFINVPVDGFLVRLENFHKGWKASIDGIPAKVYRANYAFQAIKLPEGNHKIVFEFKTIYPILFWSYILISASLWILLNFYLYKYRIKDKILPSI